MDDTSKTIIEALGEQISFIQYKLRLAQKEAEQMKAERDELKAKLAAIPPTLSRAQYDELVDKQEDK